MGRDGIEQWLWALDAAFEGERGQSLIANLASLKDEDWLWLPEGGGRSIFDIVGHVGESKYVYNNWAFGDASMRWDQPGTVPTADPEAPREATRDWLREGQRQFRESIVGLADDGELLVQRRANWGQDYETRWLINTMVQHDVYHAGEINHIRALRQGNDRWPWEQG